MRDRAGRRVTLKRLRGLGPSPPEGVKFARLTSTGWADAATAAGEDADQARAAGERTPAFYTTSPES